MEQQAKQLNPVFIDFSTVVVFKGKELLELRHALRKHYDYMPQNKKPTRFLITRKQMQLILDFLIKNDHYKPEENFLELSFCGVPIIDLQHE